MAILLGCRAIQDRLSGASASEMDVSEGSVPRIAPRVGRGIVGFQPLVEDRSVPPGLCDFEFGYRVNVTASDIAADSFRSHRQRPSWLPVLSYPILLKRPSSDLVNL
jgi:hypothetical protein